LIRAEKLHEDLVTSDEIARLYETDSHYVVSPPVGNWSPAAGMKKVDLVEYNSSHAEMFDDSELVEHIRECIVMLGLE
jgi:FlaA1/EpsC-like NDP-sugar epimerase